MPDPGSRRRAGRPAAEGEAGLASQPVGNGAADRAAAAPKGAGRSRAHEASDMTLVVGENLRRLRKERGLSLEGLARESGVSRAMLGQVELGKSAPTINVLWKIARAFDVPFSALISMRGGASAIMMPADRARVLASTDGTFRSRALFPPDDARHVEFYELRLAPAGVEEATPHPPGTTENLVVSAGTVIVRIGGSQHRLETGDALWFQADGPHAYHNPGSIEAVMYLVMTYATG